LTGLIEVGTPGQIFDFQFDTVFGETLVGSVSQDSVLGYNSNLSTSFVPYSGLGEYLIAGMPSDSAPTLQILYLETANDTFNIGGRLYPCITFGLLTDSTLWDGGARGVVGLDRRSNFMYEIKNQLTGQAPAF
jgi:hypothetical protein